MNALRIAALVACGLGAALVSQAADQSGPAPSDIIYPRNASTGAGAASTPTGGESAAIAVSPAAPGNPAVFAPGPAPSMGGLLPTLGYLVAFGALFGGAWLLLKRGGLRKPFGKSDGKLRVLETKMLGNRQFLMVVEYDDAKLLLGVCPGKIEYLTPLAGHPLATGANGVMTGRDDDEEPVAISFPNTEARR
jgi:flagellar protein FliO/FliZ